MQIAPLPPRENERLAFLHSLEILDTEPEERFDSITRLASQVLGAKYAAVSLIDSDRQWFKSACGLDVKSTSRDVSFCSHAILEPYTMAVEDALLDPRFHDNPLVTDGPKIRAYLGRQLFVNGVPLGALCALFTEPKTFSEKDKETICDLARLTEEMISHGRFRQKVDESLDKVLRAGDDLVFEALHLNSEPTLLVDSNNWTVSGINEACASELDLSPDEISGKPFPLAVRTTDRIYSDLQSSFLADGKVKDFEISIQPTKGDSIQYLCTAVAANYRNRSHILITGCNISRLKQREILLQNAREHAEAACRAKGSFLANMSHELRTPMNSILGYTQYMALDKTLDEESKETLRIVNDSGEHLLQLINNVLEMSQIEAGEIKLVSEPVELRKTIQGIYGMLSHRAHSKGLELGFTVDSSIPEFVELDPVRVRQILINLVVNAIKFTDQGSVEIRLKEDDRFLLFEVEDTGRGIPQDALVKLFKPFEQVNRRHGLEGTGLGLSISKAYTEAMEGFISVKSVVGTGSTFSLRIPLVEATGSNTAGEDEPAAVRTTSNAEKARILVADDMDAGRKLLRKLLTPRGFEIREAKDGFEATSIDHEWRPDIILMDLRMPVMSGDEAASAIRKHRGNSQPVILAITASVFREDLMVPDSPFDGYISKPFRIHELLDEINRHIPEAPGNLPLPR